MKSKFMLIVVGIILVVVVFIKVDPFNREEKENKNQKTTVISDLTELFPSKAMTLKFEEGDNKYQLKVTDVKKENDTTTIVTQYDMKDGKETTTVETTYVIFPEKVVESGKYISNGEVVSVIYPTELLIGIPYENMSWKSADELITNKVVSMKNNQVTIESVRVIDTYEEGKSEPIKKDYKETRVFEKNKGIVLFRSEIVGDKATVSERKLVK